MAVRVESNLCNRLISKLYYSKLVELIYYNVGHVLQNDARILQSREALFHYKVRQMLLESEAIIIRQQSRC